MDFRPSPRSAHYRDRVAAFVRERVLPLEARLLQAHETRARTGDWRRWELHPEIEALKERARAEGLWNLWLPPGTGEDGEKLGAGLSVVEYAPVAEEMGRSLLAPEIFNCNAPDTGNMELLLAHGSEEHKERWLGPLLAGKIRSGFCMTEPDVASSDATNIRATARVEGDTVVLDGRKWWTTGLGHPRCEVLIFMGLTDPHAPRHQRHSMVLVPLDTPGVKIQRMLPVFGEFDEPYGHGEVSFDDVRLPVSSILGGPGMGFLLAQDRLGPGRIHHCMRCVGGAERALELMVARGLSREAFGKPLVDLGGNRERIAEHRVAIDQARLLTLHAAWKLQEEGAMGALADVSAIKLVAPNVLQRVVDDAIQMHGGAGLSNDTPLAGLYAYARVLRLADGPDEVHRGLLARLEVQKHQQKAQGGSRDA